MADTPATPILNYLMTNSNVFNSLIKKITEDMQLIPMVRKDTNLVIFPHKAPGLGVISVVGLLITYHDKKTKNIHNEIYLPPLPDNLSQFKKSVIMINSDDLQNKTAITQIANHITIFLTQYMSSEIIINACLQSFSHMKKNLFAVMFIQEELKIKELALPDNVADLSISAVYSFYNLKIKRNIIILISQLTPSGIMALNNFFPAKTLEDAVDKFKMFQN